MSWWIALDRTALAKEIAKRYELNKPEDGRGGYRWSEKSTADRSSRGGQAAVRVGAHLKKAD